MTDQAAWAVFTDGTLLLFVNGVDMLVHRSLAAFGEGTGGVRVLGTRAMAAPVFTLLPDRDIALAEQLIPVIRASLAHAPRSVREQQAAATRGDYDHLRRVTADPDGRWPWLWNVATGAWQSREHVGHVCALVSVPPARTAGLLTSVAKTVVEHTPEGMAAEEAARVLAPAVDAAKAKVKKASSKARTGGHLASAAAAAAREVATDAKHAVQEGLDEARAAATTVVHRVKREARAIANAVADADAQSGAAFDPQMHALVAGTAQPPQQ
jgi:hypothetical protein